MVDEEDAFWFAHVVDESPGLQKQPICQRPALRAGPPMLSFSLAIMSQQVKKTAPATNFEQAMKRLEEIVEQMESGDLPLEDLIVRYEEGMKLVKVCQERLASAEHRIEIITRNSAGKPVVKEFEAPAAAPAPAAPPEPKGEPKNVDVSLF
jgi:exodeoxyribonuclease VII small subunit